MKHRTLLCAMALLVIGNLYAYSQSVENLYQFQSAPSPHYSLFLQNGTLWGTTYRTSGSTTLFTFDISTRNFTTIYTTTNRISGNTYYLEYNKGNQRIYGIIENGERNDRGALFSVKPDGSAYQANIEFGRQALYNPKGYIASSGLYLYGAAQSGNASYPDGGIWSAKNGNEFNILYKFVAGSTGKNCGGLVLADNYLYGLNFEGGNNNNKGTLFKVKIDGTDSRVLKHFNSTDGANPLGAVLIVGNKIYGMTSKGGTNDKGVIFSMDTTGLNYSVLHSFGSANDGVEPKGSLTLHEGNLYGVTSAGGINGVGIIFQIGVNGAGYKKLHDFNNAGQNGDGYSPQFDRFAVYEGALYGATSLSVSGFGSIYKLSLSDPLTIKIASTTGYCSGSSTGELGNNVTVSGGVEPYTYSWSGANLDPATKNTKNARIAAAPVEGSLYTLTVTDATGATALAQTTVDIGTLEITGTQNYIAPIGTQFSLGDRLIINGNAPYRTTWTGPRGLLGIYDVLVAEPDGVDGSLPVITAYGLEVYHVLVTDSYGCSCSGYFRVWGR